MQIAIFAVAIYTYLAISNWQDGLVGSRLNLTMGGTRTAPTVRITKHRM